MATVANIFIDAGTDYSTSLSISAEDGGPLDLDGYTVEAKLRHIYSSSKVVDFNIIMQSVRDGEISLTLSNEVTSEMGSGRWFYDVKITSAVGEISRILEGIATVSPQVT